MCFYGKNTIYVAAHPPFVDKKIWLSKSVVRSAKITNQEKETKREDFGVVYGSILGLIAPHVRRKE